MKKFLYVVTLFAAILTVSACQQNNDPAPVEPVVGRWELNRGVLNGFAAPNTNLNGVAIDLSYFGFDDLFESTASRIDVRTDKTFTNNLRRNGIVFDAKGTWEYANTTLTLKYDDGDSETLSYASTNGVEELSAPAQNITLPVSASATAAGRIQVIYRK